MRRLVHIAARKGAAAVLAAGAIGTGGPCLGQAPAPPASRPPDRQAIMEQLIQEELRQEQRLRERQGILRRGNPGREIPDVDARDWVLLGPGRVYRPSAEGPSEQEIATVRVDPALREAVSKLEDADFAAREAASRALTDAAKDKLQIYALLNQKDLTSEQRYRLLQVLRQALLLTPRGAIGIKMQPPVFNANGGPFEVRVMELLPGLPAEKVLQIGDRIIKVDDEPIRQYDDLQFRVQNKRPGDKVTLEVMRARVDEAGKPVQDPQDHHVVYDTLHMEVELGSAELLKGDPQMGSQRSRVELDRIFEAEAASRSRAPAAQPIQVRGGPDALVSATAAEDAGADPQVDRYPALQSLLKQRQLIVRGEMVESPGLRDFWEQQLAMLLVAAQSPALNPQQRDFMQRVADRYARLIEPQ